MKEARRLLPLSTVPEDRTSSADNRSRELPTPIADRRSPKRSRENAAARHPTLLPDRQRHAYHPRALRIVFDASEHTPIDVGHRKYTGAATTIQQRHELQAVIEPFAGTPRLKARERVELTLRAVEAPIVAHLIAPQVFTGNVHAPERRILTQVAQDVRQLQSDAKIVGESVRLLLLASAKDRQAQPANRAGDQATVDEQVLKALIACALDVHTHTGDQVLKRFDRQRETLVGVGERHDPGNRTGRW